MLEFPAALAALTLPAQLGDTTTTVQIPVSDVTGAVAQYVALALVGAFMWGFKFLPQQVCAMLMTMRVDQLLTRAVTFGINSVAGATKDRIISIDVGNRVLKEALTYALMHGGTLVKRFAGSPVDLAEKIWSRLELPADAVKPDFASIAAQVAVTLPAKVSA